MSQKIFFKDLVTISKSKFTLKFNKPAYVEMCMLDLSKVLMYEFHYDYIKNKYGNNSRLLFTSKNSFMYEIKTEDLKILSQANSLIANNNNIRNVILEIKNDRCKIVKILIFRSLSREIKLKMFIKVLTRIKKFYFL